jgi:hypothetical protein
MCSHHPHASQMLADNMVTLHFMANPNCGGFSSFKCGDHWHVGHNGVKAKAQCTSNRKDDKVRFKGYK